jgi:hypothetical protein
LHSNPRHHGSGRERLDPRDQARLYRLIVQRDGRRVRLWTRNGQPGGSRLFRRFRRLAAQQPFEPARAGSRELLVLTGNLAEIEQWRLTLTPTQHSGCG